MRPDGAGVRIEVSDDERGIPAEELVHVFECFRTGSGECGSTGVRPSIVKHLADVHGGRVVLEARPKGGITAVVELWGIVGWQGPMRILSLLGKVALPVG